MTLSESGDLLRFCGHEVSLSSPIQRHEAVPHRQRGEVEG
jgi:hypothetical protein